MNSLDRVHIHIQGEGHPLVFFHGWGFDHQIWLSLIAAMKKNYRLYLVDLPGFGLSPRMTWSSFKQSLLSQVPQPFAVVGWSMGGLFATRLAIEHQDCLTHLINIASSPCFVKKSDWVGIDRLALEQFYKNLIENPRQALAEFIELQFKGITSYSYHSSTPETESLKAGLEILTDWDLRAPLHAVNKSTCFMFGGLDAIVPRATLGIMRQIYPQFNYILFPKAAHAPFLSHANEFIEQLDTVIGGV